MNLFATALVMGILFLPGTGSSPSYAVPTTASSSDASLSAGEDPSPRKVATTKVVATDYQVKLTAYNAVPSQTDADPSVTASGISSNSEVVAARSLDLADELPYGTVVKITREGTDTPGCNFHKVESLIGYRVIADSMNARWTNRVDVELDSTDTVAVDGREMNPAFALGVCSTVKITVVGHLPLSRIPATQAALASLFETRELAING